MMSVMELVEVGVSCPSEANAMEIGANAVRAHLAACAHVSALRSVYRWQGEVHEDAEWSLSLKSRDDLFERLAELIRNGHPYELPAIMSHPCGADEATAAWIDEVTD
jgi:periplasmic divalent cation tolerance protein